MMTTSETIGRMCAWCGVAFVLEAREIAWYRERSFELPKRCRACRALRRERAAAEQARAALETARSPAR